MCPAPLCARHLYLETLWQRAPGLSALQGETDQHAAIAARQQLQAGLIDLERSTFFFAVAQDPLRSESAH